MKVVIIGGIAAGMSAAAKLRRLDRTAEIKVYEKADYVSFGACGLPYYVGGFFENVNQMIARTPEKHRESGIDIYEAHEVLSVDTTNKTLQVKNLKEDTVFEESYDKLMIATGAAAIKPPIKNLELGNVYTLKSMEDGIALREKMLDSTIKRVAIIGAGFIGIEAAEAAIECGKEVSLFQLEERVLKDVFDKEVTDLIEEELRSHGVDLHLKTMVTELQGEEKVNTVITNTGTVAADLVIIATGVRPSTEFLKDTGIEMIGNGAIIVNNKGETSIADIYAAGDCATIPHHLKEEPAYIPLATGANKLGRIVGENLGGQSSVFEGTLGSSCIKAIGIEAGRTGLSELEAEKAGIPYSISVVSDKNQTDYYPGQEAILVKIVYHKETKVLLGAQVVGKKDAVQRTNALAVAIYSKLTTSQLGMMDFCYAPPFARTWDVMNITGNVAK